MDLEKMKMTAGVLGKMPREQAIKETEMEKAIRRGAILGPYVLGGLVYVDGIGAWEPKE